MLLLKRSEGDLLWRRWRGKLRSRYEPYRDSDPYAPTWRRLTAQRRHSFEMDLTVLKDPLGTKIGDDPVADAAELIGAGEIDTATALLMERLLADLRCLDAHAHLGLLELDLRPERALAHYEVGTRIGELSLPADFDGVLLWGLLDNRPYLRCLHGYGLCLWRFGRLGEAREVFERVLRLNPADNQGARFSWFDVRAGRSFEEACRQGETFNTGTQVL